jgi:phosphoglycolate phosphatase
MLRRPSLIVFDLDGTLVDSAPDIAYSVDAMLEKLGLPPVGEGPVRHWIGNGPAMLVKRALTGEMWPVGEPARFAEAYPIFMAVYEANMCDRSRLFPGVAEGLAALRVAGYKLACNTNKNSVFTLPLLDHLGIAGCFDFTGCGDQFTKLKPDPEPLLRTAEYFGLEPAACVMVGDSANDGEAARRAGFGFVAVPYGYHGGAGVDVLGPDAVVGSIADLPTLFSPRST